MKKPFNRDFPITQTFGNEFTWSDGKPYYARFGLSGHNGIDYGLPNGTQVLAPHAGKVIEMDNEGKGGYGKYLKIESDREGSVLAHLKEFAVSLNQEVQEGQLIALSDNTGASTGPHLHWGYYRQPRNRANGYNGFIDQTPHLDQAQEKKYTEGEMTDMRLQRDKNNNLYEDMKRKLKEAKDSFNTTLLGYKNFLSDIKRDLKLPEYLEIPDVSGEVAKLKGIKEDYDALNKTHTDFVKDSANEEIQRDKEEKEFFKSFERYSITTYDEKSLLGAVGELAEAKKDCFSRLKKYEDVQEETISVFRRFLNWLIRR